MHIADFHCDLLAYLSKEEGNSPYDNVSRASIPQLCQGNVKLQTMAIFTETQEGSTTLGEKQFQHFISLPTKYPKAFKEKVQTILSIENGSSFCNEQEPLTDGLKRLERWSITTPIAYISLTWNGENRFGGGCGSTKGLKPDGHTLLEWMEDKSIAVDLSHTSDTLAKDILKAIEGSSITPIASHSNFRSIVNHPRNLTDSIAIEIGKRGGLIGLNFVRTFLKDFTLQIQHAKKLCLLDHFCFGADFFADTLRPSFTTSSKSSFYEGFDSAACYPKVINVFLELCPKTTVEKIAYHNLYFFLHPLLGKL
jgi:membrane dipeptidase